MPTAPALPEIIAHRGNAAEFPEKRLKDPGPATTSATASAKSNVSRPAT